MRLITTTLAHAGAASKLSEALTSASWADMHLVVDTTPEQPEVKATHIDPPDGETWPGPIVTVDWPWRHDFAAARNELLDRATKYATADVCWAITLDTDERLLCPDPAALRAELAATDADVCMAFHVSGMYPKERLFRLPTTARWVGRTHECAIGWQRRHTLSSLRFDEEGKTAEQYRAKLVRDEELLRLDIENNPSDSRWWYYLGDTQDSLGKHKEAVVSFERCAACNGWDEEAAWACYRAAKILIGEAENWPDWEEKKRKLQRVIDLCTAGLARHACFPELTRFAALAAFWKGESHKATAWSHMTIALGDYKGCKAMAHRTSFRDVSTAWEMPFDVLKFSAGTPEERAHAALEQDRARYARWGGPPERLAIDRSSQARGEARGELGKFARPLGEMMPASVYPIEHVGRPDYANMNPSMCVHGGRIVCIVRTVNYHIDDGGNYVSLPEDEGVIKTDNWLCEVLGPGWAGLRHPSLDPDALMLDALSLVNARPIVDVSGRQTFATRVLGYEDMRPLSVGGKLYACATVRDSRLDMRCEMAVCEISLRGARVNAHWAAITAAHLQRSDVNEKNWAPLEVDGLLAFLYWSDPTIIRRWNPETKQCDLHVQSTPEFSLDHLRGGSQAVPIEGGHLYVTHEVVWLGGKRAYLHRFVRLDRELRVVGVSGAWYLQALQIEFCSGMCHLDATRMLLGFGVRDARAVLVVVSTAEAVAACKSWKEWTT